MDVRDTVGAPLIVRATADGADYLTAQERMWQAHRALSTTGRFGRRSAARAVRETTEAHGAMQDAVRQRWGDVPHTATHLPFWAEAVAEQRVRADPRVIEAQQAAEHAHLEQQELTSTHSAARSAQWQGIGGGYLPSSLKARVTELRGHAQHSRDTLTEIETLPVTAAAQLIRDRAAQAEAEGIEEAARLARAAERAGRHSPSPVYPSYPERGFGPGL